MIKLFWKHFFASLNHLLKCLTGVSLLNLVGLILWGTIPFCYFVFGLFEGLHYILQIIWHIYYSYGKGPKIVCFNATVVSRRMLLHDAMWSAPRRHCTYMQYTASALTCSLLFLSLFCNCIRSFITMPPSITSEKITLTYPIFGAAFIDGNRLLVGGGGGEGRSGVGNKIVRVPFLGVSLKTSSICFLLFLCNL